MKKFLLVAVMGCIAFSGYGQSDSKVNVKVGGTLETKFYYNSYQSKAARDGAQYFYPLAPQYDREGKDLNKEGFLGFSVAPSRLNVGITGPKLLNSEISAYFEMDFMGTSDNLLEIIRMRHAWAKMTWKKSSLLFGQTNHLSMVDEVTPNTIAFGSGMPFNPMHRSVQARFTHELGTNVQLLLAAHMYNFNRSAGPEDAQQRAAIPDFQLQMKFGDASNVIGGFTAGYRFLKPRSIDDAGFKINKRVGSYDAGVFLRARVEGYTMKLWGMIGENLSHLSMIGGYGKLLSDANERDYGYANTTTMSVWAEFETPRFDRLQYGVFVGYQDNLGAMKKLDRDTDGKFIGYFRDTDLKNICRISPRILYYVTDQFTIGLEYMFDTALWGKEFDDKYKSIDEYKRVQDHRIELAVKFKF